jgi:hypothetical protein
LKDATIAEESGIDLYREHQVDCVVLDLDILKPDVGATPRALILPLVDQRAF